MRCHVWINCISELPIVLQWNKPIEAEIVVRNGDTGTELSRVPVHNSALSSVFRTIPTLLPNNCRSLVVMLTYRGEMIEMPSKP